MQAIIQKNSIYVAITRWNLIDQIMKLYKGNNFLSALNTDKKGDRKWVTERERFVQMETAIHRQASQIDSSHTTWKVIMKLDSGQSILEGVYVGVNSEIF